MPKRLIWSLMDVAGLICLGQATMLAQRQPALLAPVLESVALQRAESGFAGAGTRIYETAGHVVVAIRAPEQPIEPLQVNVLDGHMRIGYGDGQADAAIPIPARARPASYRIQRVSEEVRVIFAKRTPKEAP